jgi:hypothetical protein
MKIALGYRVQSQLAFSSEGRPCDPVVSTRFLAIDAATEEGKFETKVAARAAMHSMVKRH